MTLQAVIFDKDGTLFDFQATWGAWTNKVLDHLCGSDVALKKLVAADLDYDLDALEIRPASIVVAATPMEIAGHIVHHFPGMTSVDILENLNGMAEKSTQVPVTDLAKLCADLRGRGLKLAVMTNDAEAPARANLDSVGALDLFDIVIGSDSGHGAKPSPDPLLALAKMMNVAPENCLMVGDSTHDLIAGGRAGMGRVAVLTGLATAADLTDYADVVLPNISDIPAWIDQQSTRV